MFTVMTYIPDPATQDSAPIVQGPDYNKPSKPARHKTNQSMPTPAVSEYHVPVNTRMQDVDRTKCDPCTGLAWDVGGIVNLFEENEVAAEREFSGRSGLVHATVSSIETNLDGARVTFEGPFFGPSVACLLIKTLRRMP